MADDSNELDQVLDVLRHDPDRALAMCERYVSEHPDDADGLFSRFQALRRLCKYDRALMDINHVLELEPNSGGFSIRGGFFHEIGEHERAIDDLTRARIMNEYEWQTSFDPHIRADSYARLGRLDEALTDCALIPDDHWMPAGVCGDLPGGNKEEFIAEIKRRAALARNDKA